MMHVPDFLSMSSMDYRMVGMPMSPMMLTGMAAIVTGLLLSTYGLVPSLAVLRGSGQSGTARYYARAMDDAPVTPAHWWLLFVLGVALVIDVMKPATLGFILPGLRAEYGLSTSQAVPFVARPFTIGRSSGALSDARPACIGSAGGDVLPRRPSAGSCRRFGEPLHVLRHGLSPGGMLPIVCADGETVPARARMVVILHGGWAPRVSAASAWPRRLNDLRWRIRGSACRPVSHRRAEPWIPESRVLLEHGQVDAARDVMRRFG
jgi:putative MFS transporter